MILPNLIENVQIFPKLSLTDLSAYIIRNEFQVLFGEDGDILQDSSQDDVGISRSSNIAFGLMDGEFGKTNRAGVIGSGDIGVIWFFILSCKFCNGPAGWIKTVHIYYPDVNSCEILTFGL